jgi:hypothetical protein
VLQENQVQMVQQVPREHKEFKVQLEHKVKLVQQVQQEHKVRLVRKVRKASKA